MDYLFFDIECCDGVHICSFGYIVVDKNFKNAKKYDILMNPNHPFKLGKVSNPYIKLAHSNEEFESAPTFDHFYGRLKRLFEKKDRMFFGFSTNSDLNFLKIACQEYDLPNFDITSYDLQKIFQKFAKASHVESLESVCNHLGINTQKFHLHKSCDDAHLTMLVAKKLCKMQKCTLDDLAEQFQFAKFLSKNLGKKSPKKCSKMPMQRQKQMQ